MRQKGLQEAYRGGRFKEWEAGYLRIAEITSVNAEDQKVDLRFVDTPGVRRNVKLTYPYASFNSAGIMYIPQVGDTAVLGVGKSGRVFVLSYIPEWIHGEDDVPIEGKVYPYFTLSPGEVFLRSKYGPFVWLETYGELLSRIVLGDIKQNRFQIEQDNRKMFGTTGLWSHKAAGVTFEFGEARQIVPEGLDVPYVTDTNKGWNRAKLFIPEYYHQAEGKEAEDTWQEENPIVKVEAGTVLETVTPEGNGEEPVTQPVVNEDGNELCLRVTTKKGGLLTDEGIRVEIDKKGQLEIFGQKNLHIKFDDDGNALLEVKKFTVKATEIKLGETATKGIARLKDIVETEFWSGLGTIESASSKVKAE